MEKKMTKAVAFDLAVKALEATNGSAEAIEILKNQIEILANRSSSKKPTKAQKENEEVVIPLILATLERVGCPVTISQLNKIEGLEVYSPNKINAIVKILRERGLVKRTYEKKVAYFTLGKEAEEEQVEQGE